MKINSPHIPVLLEETISQLVINPSGIYVDGTLGYGGHSAEILRRLDSSGMLIGLDLNPNAISFSNSRLSAISNNYLLKLSNFKSFSKILFEKNIRNIHGFFLDLGLSSPLIDNPEYGFSFQNNGPLDMQFDRNGKNSAEKYLNQVEEIELVKIIKLFGEEPNARKIANEIVQRARMKKMKTTFDLKDAICKVVPRRFQVKAMARVFQAIRIKINDELEVLSRALKLAVQFLNPGCRIAVISYHSLEDKLVKSFFRLNSVKCICPVKLPICSCNINPKLKKITSKAIIPTIENIKNNSRARSARLRIAEKL